MIARIICFGLHLRSTHLKLIKTIVFTLLESHTERIMSLPGAKLPHKYQVASLDLKTLCLYFLRDLTPLSYDREHFSNTDSLSIAPAQTMTDTRNNSI